jgi:acyl-CoA oxidase
LEVIGCFCLTELGFGNNTVKMETTSTYDADTGEFVVNSPTDLSQKYWISNGAHHANHALVFGQTIVKGKNEGVNAFLVRIREEDGSLRRGVQLRDMGIKIGVNAVDNAIIRFENVRVPRVNLMNKYGDVTEKGDFVSPYDNINVRFFKVTERLLSGRICIAAGAVGGARACLWIALKYAQQRKSIGPEGLSTVPILNYQLQ